MFHVSSVRNRCAIERYGLDVSQMAAAMLDNGNGFFYSPGRIPVDRITLVQEELPGGDPHRYV